jgi:hypothetical protein
MSCSSLQKNPDTQLPELAKKICLDSEGRGRFESKEGKYVVGYESLFNKEQSKWSIALRAPLFGEEVLHIRVAKPGSVKRLGHGPFWQRLKLNAAESSQLSELSSFSSAVSEMLFLMEKVKQSKSLICSGGNKDGFSSCVAKGNGYHRKFNYRFASGHLIVKFKMRNELWIELDSFDLGDSTFKRLNLSFYPAGSRINPLELKTLYKMNLFIRSCHQ